MVANKVKRKQETYNLYASGVDDDKWFEPPEDVSLLLQQAEYLVEKQLTGDYDEGMLFAIQELLSVPVALMQEKVKEMLSSIIEDADDEDDEDEEKEDKQMKHLTANTKTANDNANEEEPDISDEETLRQLDEEERARVVDYKSMPSLKFLNEWYLNNMADDSPIKEWGVMTYMEKLKAYETWSAEQEAKEPVEQPD